MSDKCNPKFKRVHLLSSQYIDDCLSLTAENQPMIKESIGLYYKDKYKQHKNIDPNLKNTPTVNGKTVTWTELISLYQ